jgi:hypothetical protein
VDNFRWQPGHGRTGSPESGRQPLPAESRPESDPHCGKGEASSRARHSADVVLGAAPKPRTSTARMRAPRGRLRRGQAESDRWEAPRAGTQAPRVIRKPWRGGGCGGRARAACPRLGQHRRIMWPEGDRKASWVLQRQVGGPGISQERERARPASLPGTWCSDRL